MAELVGVGGADKIRDILSSEDDTTDEKIPIEVEEETEKEEEKEELELKEEEETEKEEIPDEELELINHVGQKEILKKYPELFKEFPSLKRAYFKEQQYAEILPTIDDAREAVESAESFKQFEEKLLSGSGEAVLRSVKEADPEAFNRIVDNYLPDLQKVDPNAWTHVMNNIVKSAAIAMSTTAERDQNEELATAAREFFKYFFPNQNFTPPSNLSNGKKEDNNLQSERAAWEQEQFDSARGNLEGRITNILTASVSEAIDPRGSMSGYVKKTAVREALELLDNHLASDKAFTSVIDKLWKNAKDSKFAGPALEKIKSTYLSKAKVTLPSLIAQVRKEAMKGNGKTSNEDRAEPKDKKLVGTGRTASSNGKGKFEKPKGMSIRDFLDQD